MQILSSYSEKHVFYVGGISMQWMWLLGGLLIFGFVCWFTWELHIVNSILDVNHWDADLDKYLNVK